jgi:quercetin dioxygenase-like cupin family protein
MSTERREDGRLRQHPAKRFAPSERKFDLEECYDELLSEPHEPTDGHRQITLAHHESLTLILFHFEEGSSLPEHVVEGAVTIHILEGEVEIETKEEVHHLEDDQVLVLAPKVKHDFRAVEETRMLLTVHLARKQERSSVNPPD